MVQVKVSEGVLEGELVENEYGGTFYSFKGIPFAQPPTGDLRFKAPQPPKPWQGVRSAKEFGPICYQFSYTNHTLDNMSEDCLYLNVYSPDIKPTPPIPVMVWIHGGGFIWGSGNDDLYGPEYLITHDVVLVTLNYRLEALGFLCLDTPDIPGNAGVKDQVAALRWIKKNISNFGGDSENITIFGESAGAGSVACHLISPMSRGLFKRVICQSGAATCFWSRAFEPRERALLLARQLGFLSEDDQELYHFFKTLPVESLVNLKLQITMSQKSHDRIYFTVVDEKDFGNERFFFGDIVDAVKTGTHKGVDIMTGYTQHEGLMALAISDAEEEIITSAKCYRDFFTPKHIQTHCPMIDHFKAARLIRKFYFKGEDMTADHLDQLIKFLGTDMFAHGVMLTAKLNSKSNTVYFYKFSCTSERNCFSSFFGVGHLNKEKSMVCHADDLAYLFPIKVLSEKVHKNSKTFKLINRVTTLWTNFAKYGNPTPDNSLEVKWNPFTAEEQDYLEIGNELKPGKSPDKEEMECWNDVFREILPKFCA